MRLRLCLFCLLALVTACPVAAQSHLQTSRSFVQSPQVLGAGGATVAAPSRATPFFYNPAHLAQVGTVVPHINILGVRGQLGTGIFDQIAFYNDDLQPAIDAGIANLSVDRVESLYNEARNLGRKRTFAGGGLLLPSVIMNINGIGVGAGLFADSRVRYRFENGGAGIPLLNMAGRGDIIAVASGGVDGARFGVDDLSVGLTAKFTQRYFTVKNKLVDTIEADEDLYLLSANSVGVDLGLLYELSFVPLPGQLNAGAAFYDLAASDFNYTYDSNLTGNAPADQETIDDEVALANERYGLSSSYRLGLAYTLSAPLHFLGQTGVMLDYIGYADPLVDQTTLAHLHIGAQADLLNVLALRIGLNQGYATFGAGLKLGFVKLDYAYSGLEEGRRPGDVPNWNHYLQMTFGLF